MKQTTVLMTLLSGLCFLPAYSHSYHLVKKSMTWAEAQDYCRREHTDLATVDNEQDLARLNELIKEETEGLWIGLQPDTESWRWSLENKDSYGEGGTDFRMWDSGEPDGQSYHKVCAAMLQNGKWGDLDCYNQRSFFCYNKNTSRFIQVDEIKSWVNAQSYCREHHTDLASVRNESENEKLKMLLKKPYTWIGLYRSSWKWSDGSTYLFTNWAPNKPSSTFTDSCGASVSGKWVNNKCTKKRFFVCYSAVKERKMLRVVLKTADSSVDMEALKEDILERFRQRLMEQGLSGDVKLKWVKQRDGKNFHKKGEEEQEEEKEELCTIK